MVLNNMFQNIENQRVKDLRGHLSLKDFALPLGVSADSISKIETGKVGLSIDMAKKICKAYNVSIAWLFGETDDRMPSTVSIVEVPSSEYVPKSELIDIQKKYIALLEKELNKSEIRQTSLEKL